MLAQRFRHAPKSTIISYILSAILLLTVAITINGSASAAGIAPDQEKRARFEDPAFGYAFTYPQAGLQMWMSLSNPDTQPDFVIRRQISLQPASLGGIHVAVWTKPADEDVDAWGRRVVSYEYIAPNRPDPNGPTTVGGAEARAFIEPGQQALPIKAVLFTRGNTAYRLIGRSLFIASLLIDAVEPLDSGFDGG